MKRSLLPLNALRAFEAAGRYSSLTDAASELCVSPSALSRHVSKLENLAGVRLFDRTPAGLLLTNKGKELLPSVSQALDMLCGSLEGLVEDAHQLELRVAFPPTFAHLLAVPLLNRFRSANADIVINLESPRMPPDVVKQNFDLAIVYGPPEVSEHRTDLLWMEQVTPLVHPSTLEDLPSVSIAAFLSAIDLIHIRVPQGPHLTWKKWLRSQNLVVNAETGLVFDTAHLAAQYVLNGRAVMLSDPQLFSARIASGDLVAPFPALVAPSGYGYFLLCRDQDRQGSPISRLREWLIREFVR